MSGSIDVLSTYRIPFSETIDNAGPADIVALRNISEIATLIEVLELNIAVRDTTTLTANEHVGFYLAHLSDASTPSDIAAGSGGSDITNNVDSGFPWGLVDGNDFNSLRQSWEVRTCDGTLAAGTATDFRRGWHGGWNLQIPFSKVWQPADRPTFAMRSDAASSGSIPNIDALVWRTTAAASVDLDVSGYMVVRLARFGWD